MDREPGQFYLPSQPTLRRGALAAALLLTACAPDDNVGGTGTDSAGSMDGADGADETAGQDSPTPCAEEDRTMLTLDDVTIGDPAINEVSEGSGFDTVVTVNTPDAVGFDVSEVEPDETVFVELGNVQGQGNPNLTMAAQGSWAEDFSGENGTVVFSDKFNNLNNATVAIENPASEDYVVITAEKPGSGSGTAEINEAFSCPSEE